LTTNTVVVIDDVVFMNKPTWRLEAMRHSAIRVLIAHGPAGACARKRPVRKRNT
jgi:hypothetical protein